MSDVYLPGIKSRFNSETTIEELMKLERIPKERAEKNIERIENEKSYWQELNRRTVSLRDSARQLFSYQNPFNDRLVRSGNDSVLSGTAARDAIEQERSFTVKQIAQADRFLSSPLAEDFNVERGNYSFSVGADEISFEFRGGTLKEFSDALNRRGKEKLSSSLITVKPGTTSLLIESKVTGEENRLVFSGAAAALGERTGMIARSADSGRDILGEAVQVNSGDSNRIPVNFTASANGNWTLRLETSTQLRPDDPSETSGPLPGPSIPSGGSVSYNGIEIENDASSIALPPQTSPEPRERIDNLGVLSLAFSDGTVAELPPISDSSGFNSYQYDLQTLAAGKTIVSLNLANNNTHRDVSIRNVRILDSDAPGGMRPLNAVSVARDAVISMDGIEIRRAGNEISDMIPGVTITARGISDTPVSLQVEPDRETAKDALIGFVGNYNRLMAEINVLTRNDPRVIEELTYLTDEEKTSYREMLGAFAGDSTLMQMRNSLIRIVSAPYPTSEEQNLTLLAQIGIGTDVRRAGGTDASRLRGYLEIDERALDDAIAAKLPAIKQLFGSDTSGDLLVDTGIAYALDNLIKPYSESGGLFAFKTGNMDSRITQERQRITTLDRQLAAKEADLKRQYSQMESAYGRMEQMSQSFNRLGGQNGGNSR